MWLFGFMNTAKTPRISLRSKSFKMLLFSHICSKKPFTSRLNVTPKKRKLNFSPMKAPPWSSPTIDLPNLVMDGKSPHNRPPGTSVKTPRRALDWLSAMSKKRKSEDICGAAEASPTPSKQGKSSRSSSKATTPASTAKAATPKSNRKRKRL